MRLSVVAGAFLFDLIAWGIAELVNKAAADAGRSITVADLHAVAQRYLRPELRTVVIAEPSGEASDEDEAEGDDDGAEA